MKSKYKYRQKVHCPYVVNADDLISRKINYCTALELLLDSWTDKIHYSITLFSNHLLNTNHVLVVQKGQDTILALKDSASKSLLSI